MLKNTSSFQETYSSQLNQVANPLEPQLIALPNIQGGIIQMGARVYIPALGRFLSVDSVEGETDNNYVYANDPVNQEDLDGRALPVLVGILLWQVARAAAPHVARVAVKYVAKPASQFVAKKVIPNLTKKAMAAANKIVPAVRSGVSKA